MKAKGAVRDNGAGGVSPRRVLHLLEATLGGTRRYLENIIRATAGADYEQGLAFAERRSDSGFQDVLKAARYAGWSCFPVDMTRSIHPVTDLAAVIRTRSVLKRFSPDLLHCHSSKAGGIGRLAALSVAQSPALVYSPHALAVHLSPDYLLIERGLALLGGSFVAVSQSEREQIVEVGVADAGRVTVVPPVVSTEEFAPTDRAAARRELGLGDGFRIIGIGRLTEQKNPLAFAQVLHRLKGSIPNVTGTWVGDGELRPELEAEAAELGLGDALQITGWLDDVRPWIAAADVLLSTARYESFGYVVPEALAMERPVVGSAVTGTIDVLEPWADVALYEAGDADAAAARIRRLAEDPELAKRYSREGRLHVERTYSESRMRERLSSAYQGALADRSSTRRANGKGGV